MAKNKKSSIPHYELLYIVANKFTEDDLKKINKNVNQLLEDNGAKITYKEDWGKKKFCFPINHGRFGYYQFVEFDVESSKVEKINTDLRLSNEVLRHMIVNHAPKTAKQIEVEKRLAEKRAAKATKKIDDKVQKKETPKPKKKVDAKELNEKLDKILETDDLL